MAFTSRFADESTLHQSVPRCPLAQLPPSDDEGACAGCRYNVVASGVAQIGCHVRTPAEVMARALQHLDEHAPLLSSELSALRVEFAATPVDADGATRFAAVAEKWLALAVTDEEREVASVIFRFARAVRLSPVEIVR